jgi:hypothetical protein
MAGHASDAFPNSDRLKCPSGSPARLARSFRESGDSNIRAGLQGPKGTMQSTVGAVDLKAGPQSAESLEVYAFSPLVLLEFDFDFWALFGASNAVHLQDVV